MTPPLRRALKRTAASLMLALAFVYLVHAAWHAAAGEVALPLSGEAVAVQFDPFVFAESQTGDGVAGCHFFCNHGCPVPPLPESPALPPILPDPSFTPHRSPSPRTVALLPEKAPPRLLA